jgi:hypothetical protein
MQDQILKILLRNYDKISINGGISKVIFDDKFEDISEEIAKICNENVLVAFKHGKLEAYGNLDKCNNKFNEL